VYKHTSFTVVAGYTERTRATRVAAHRISTGGSVLTRIWTTRILV